MAQDCSLKTKYPFVTFRYCDISFLSTRNILGPEMSEGSKLTLMESTALAKRLEESQDSEKVLLIDGRLLCEYNNGHIKDSVHMPSACIMIKRLREGKVTVAKFLGLTDAVVERTSLVVLYDACSRNLDDIPSGSPLSTLISKLKLLDFSPQLSFLKGGFRSFEASYPRLCIQAKPRPVLVDIPRQCLAQLYSNGPTQLFPHLYLGSEQDALSDSVIKTNRIDHVLNVSVTCPKADFIDDCKFKRIPVNDTHSDKLMCYFEEAFQFLDKVRNTNGCVLLHCLAGVSRSPTIAIAYVMYWKKMGYDEALRYVKERRPMVAPNFNFLGQLVDYDRKLKGVTTTAEQMRNVSIKESPKKPHLALA